MEKVFDVLVIGAGEERSTLKRKIYELKPLPGPSGLNAAKTYLECEPNANLWILDAHDTVGGVWAEENLYPGLRTNSLWSALDYTDFPMHSGYGVKPGDHVPGEPMHQYLEDYAENHGLLDRMNLNTRVKTIERMRYADADGDGDDSGGGVAWRVCCLSRKHKKEKPGVYDMEISVKTRKLILATGVTNQPNEPSIPGATEFGGPIVHSARLGREATRLLQDPSVKTVVVLGGGKSAYDAVYMFASHGKQVEWIIRRSGRGTNWVLPAHTKLMGFDFWRAKLLTRRIVSFFSPCIFGFHDGFSWIRNFLHQTRIGRVLVRRFWRGMHRGALEDCGLGGDEKFRDLTPETSPFWYGTTTAILNYPTTTFHDLVTSEMVSIVRQDVSHLSRLTVHLGNNTSVPADALITATGFSMVPPFHFSPESIRFDLGIPSHSLTTSERRFWDEKDAEADSSILAKFPCLATGPTTSRSSAYSLPLPLMSSQTARAKPSTDAHSFSPYRLYRSIAPPGLTVKGDRSIAFIGYYGNIAATVRLEITSLWAYAYLSGRLQIDESAVFRESALMSRFNMYRSPFGHGRWYPDNVFDQNAFFDMLMRDLGLPYWRKSNVFKELFEPYGQKDYRGLTQEWLRKTKTK